MWSEVFTAISLGRKIVRALADLKRDVGSVRPGGVATKPNVARFDMVEGRLDALEAELIDQNARTAELEAGLKDTLRVTEALAERISAMFWIVVTGSSIGLVGLVLSLW